MNFTELKNLIKKESKNDDNSFEHSGDLIQKKIFSLNRKKLIPLIKEIGMIPEDLTPETDLLHSGDASSGKTNLL